MLIRVKVFPGSKKEDIIKKSEDKFDLKIKEKPVEGRANQRVIEILASYFKIPLNKIRLIRGYEKRNKILEIL